MLVVKLWLVVGGGNKIIDVRGCAWIMAAKLWLVVGGHGWSNNLVMLSNRESANKSLSFLTLSGIDSKSSRTDLTQWCESDGSAEVNVKYL